MGIFKSLDSVSTESTPVGVKFITVEYTFDSFLEKMINNDLTNYQIRNKIIFSYSQFMNYDNLINPDTKKVLRKIWTTKKFLDNLYYILQENKISVDIIDTKTVNKIVFDYCFDTENSDQEIKDIMIKIIDILNFDLKLVLSSVMKPIDASQIALLSRSSFSNKECICRVNKFISKFDFTIDNIIYIYSKLYLNDFSTLFLYTMINTSDVNKTIDRSMITILESMSSIEIEKVLRRYGSYLFINNISDVRFKIKDFLSPRAKNIAISLEYEDEIVIP